MKKVGIDKIKNFVFVILILVVLLTAGCNGMPSNVAGAGEDKAVSNSKYDASLDEVNSIIEKAYREGYAQGYYDGALLERINKIAHEDGELYICIEPEEGETQYTGISNLMCVCEKDQNYYVLKAKPSTLEYSEGMINYLDGSKIDHNFDLSTIKAVVFEDYVNERFDEGRLKDCYDAFEKGSVDAISKYNAVDFEQLEIYDKLCEN